MNLRLSIKLSPFPNQIVYRRVSPSIGGTPSFVTLNFEFVLFLTLRDSSHLRVFVVDSVQALPRRREDAKNPPSFWLRLGCCCVLRGERRCRIAQRSELMRHIILCSLIAVLSLTLCRA